MPSDEVTQLLSGGGAPAAKFPTIGTSVTGVVLHAEATDQRDMEGNIKTFPDGNPMKQIVVTIQTDDEKVDADDDGRRRIFVKGAMWNALRDAIQAVKAPTLEDGARLTVTHTGVGTPSQRGYSPPKLFDVTYERPNIDAVRDAFNATEEPRQNIGGYGQTEEPF